MSEVARKRAAEAQARRREADLAAEMARVLLKDEALDDGLARARPAHRRRARLTVGVDRTRRGGARPTAHRPAVTRRGGRGHRDAAAPADLPADDRERAAGRVAPALEPLLAAALHREELRDELVETAALRQSDVKTAVLRAVSHDLRSPLTAIVTAGEALGSPSLDAEDRRELSAGVVEEGNRLAGLIDKLLDLLEAGGRVGRTAHGLECGRRRAARGRGRTGGGAGDHHLCDRARPAARAGRQRPARAGLRQPHRERGAPFGRPAGVGAGAGRGRPAGGAGRRPQPESPKPSTSGSSRPSTRPGRPRAPAPPPPARAWAWPSPAASWRPTAGGCGRVAARAGQYVRGGAALPADEETLNA